MGSRCHAQSATPPPSVVKLKKIHTHELHENRSSSRQQNKNAALRIAKASAGSVVAIVMMRKANMMFFLELFRCLRTFFETHFPSAGVFYTIQCNKCYSSCTCWNGKGFSIPAYGASQKATSNVPFLTVRLSSKWVNDYAAGLFVSASIIQSSFIFTFGTHTRT